MVFISSIFPPTLSSALPSAFSSTNHFGCVDAGGISLLAKNNTKINFCYVDSSTPIFINFSGIVFICDNSIINGCAIGKIKLENNSHEIKWRISNQLKNSPSLSNNISIDSNSTSFSNDARDGKSVSAAQFTQRYFETTLNWDFEKIWKWDAKNNRPALRSVGVNSNSEQENKSTEPTINTVDLLTQQIRNNIWL